MDNSSLEQIISEAQNRGGGMILNLNSRPAAVVLTVEKYNELLGNKTSAESFARQKEEIKKAGEGRHVLVTGGAGYIGSHLVRQLLAQGYQVTVLDNLSTGKKENLDPRAKFLEGDLADLNLLYDLLSAGGFEAVFHMAASIEVEESVREPQKYFDNNVKNTTNLLKAMHETGVEKIIFSSTAAVYGEQEKMPILETAEPRPNNPYGFNKYLCENLIKYYSEFMGLKAVIFRYFNACGCDFDGAIKPTHESHLIPIVLGVAAGRKPSIMVYGDDYNTFDGTCLRDYVHVLDICRAHILALPHVGEGEKLKIYNIGTGKGLSVKEIINGAAEVLNKIIPMEIGPRRPGDAPATVADASKIFRDLGFKTEHSDIETIIKTSWKQIVS